MGCCGRGEIPARELRWSGDIYETEVTDEGLGQDTPNEVLLYSGVKSKRLNPLRTDGSEVYELDQQVAKLKASWLIRNDRSKTITANKHYYVVEGVYYHITAVRPYKGNRYYLVLDSISRDSDSLI